MLIKVSVTWWGQSFHCYVNNLSVSEAISLCWWDLRVHYHDHRNPTASPYCSKNPFSIFLPSVSRLSKWVFFPSCSSSCPLSLLSSLQGSMPQNCAVSSCYLLSVCYRAPNTEQTDMLWTLIHTLASVWCAKTAAQFVDVIRSFTLYFHLFG